MIKKNQLLVDLKEFINGDKIEKSDNIISLGELCEFINKEINEIRKKYLDFDLNKELKKSSKTAWFSSWKNNLNATSIINFGYNDTSHIEFSKQPGETEFSHYFWSYYNKKEETNDFVKYHYDNIQKLFNLLEDYYDLIGPSSSMDSYRQKVSTKIFDITLKIDNSALFKNENLLKFKIKINSNYKNSCDLYYAGNQTQARIHSFMDKNAYEILDRIPVDVTKLSGPFRLIYENYVKKQNNEKQLLLK